MRQWNVSMDGEPPGTELLIQTPIIYVLISTKNNFKIYISTEEKTLLVLSDNNNDQKIKTKVYKCLLDPLPSNFKRQSQH